ncbi:MAG: MarR family transcriptional regulator [Synergistaceae bacterium]|jgi:DNA-binding MarR family transcriptional regulator|nr:MarR family transcriptional regulator [Synergistaceae bacterium]
MSEIKTTVTEQLEQLQILMHRASFHNFMGNGMARNPLRGQGRVLAILKMKPEISQRELTYLLNMSKQSLAELLAKLEKSGHIVREPSEDDKRVVTVKLTEEGAKAANNVDDETSETAKILDCLNDEELAIFSEYLGRIIKRYEEQFPDENFEERRKMLSEFMSQHGHGGHPDRHDGCHGSRFSFGDFGFGHGHH